MIVPVRNVNPLLAAAHYLGPTGRGFAWGDQFGVAVFASPTSRHLPRHWLELSRWCLTGGPNAGSQQFAAIRVALRTERPEATTLISYSDPAAGHTGSLYRACGWLWAPTWQRLRPPPSGGGRWSADGPQQAVKDRWVYPLAPDRERARILAIHDESVVRQFPTAQYVEPKWRGYRFRGGGGDFKHWIEQQR